MLGRILKRLSGVLAFEDLSRDSNRAADVGCHDPPRAVKALEYGLKLRIPGIEEFRQLVRQGTKISPMRNFFLAVGLLAFVEAT
jgi:hypothetical protein